MKNWKSGFVVLCCIKNQRCFLNTKILKNKNLHQNTITSYMQTSEKVNNSYGVHWRKLRAAELFFKQWLQEYQKTKTFLEKLNIYSLCKALSNRLSQNFIFFQRHEFFQNVFYYDAAIWVQCVLRGWVVCIGLHSAVWRSMMGGSGRYWLICHVFRDVLYVF